MKMANTALQFSLAWLALLIGQIVAGMIVPMQVPAMPHIFRWLMLSDALIVLALAPAVMRANWRGSRLYLAVWVIPSTIAITNMIEGVFFLTNLSIDWRGLVANSIISFAIAVALWLAIFGRWKVLTGTGADAPMPAAPGHNLRNVVLCALAYTFFYIVAGMIVYPYVREFYATQYLPPLWQISLLQLLVRGPIFMLLCLLLLRMYRLSGISAILAVAAGWAILNGVSPLIIPNPYFPDHVRWAHFCEVSSSNFLFGGFVAWLWNKAYIVRRVATALA